jgi:hypothetical protein
MTAVLYHNKKHPNIGMFFEPEKMVIYLRFFVFALDFFVCLTLRRFTVLREREAFVCEDCLFAIKIN